MGTSVADLFRRSVGIWFAHGFGSPGRAESKNRDCLVEVVISRPIAYRALESRM